TVHFTQHPGHGFRHFDFAAIAVGLGIAEFDIRSPGHDSLAYPGFVGGRRERCADKEKSDAEENRPEHGTALVRPSGVWWKAVQFVASCLRVGREPQERTHRQTIPVPLKEFSQSERGSTSRFRTVFHFSKLGQHFTFASARSAAPCFKSV